LISNKEDFETSDCIVCGADDTDKISERGQFGLPAHVVICRQCGLTYLNPRWNEVRLMNFYENEYDSYYRPDMNVATENSLYLPVYERLKAQDVQLENTRNILDIGSGEGNNLKYLMEKLPQAEYYAIEPSKACQRTLKAMNVKILGGDVGQDFDPKFEGYFDLIIMRHVLEHFFHPIEILKKVKPLLKDKGILYIAVPNSLNFGKHKLLDHCFRMVHNYYFNIHTLKNVFRKAGVQAIWMAEGDPYNHMELLAIVRKGEYEAAEIDKEFYEIQKKSFDRKLKQEKSLSGRLKSWWKNNLSKN